MDFISNFAMDCVKLFEPICGFKEHPSDFACVRHFINSVCYGSGFLHGYDCFAYVRCILNKVHSV